MTDTLVQAGKTVFGAFDAPLKLVNLIDAQPYPGIPLPRALRWLRLKEWQAFQGGDEDYFFNVSLFNGKAFGVAQMRVFERRSGAHWVNEQKLLPHQLKAPNQLYDGRFEYESAAITMRLDSQWRRHRVGIAFDSPASSDRPAISGELEATYDAAEPLVVSIPLRGGGSMYSQKGTGALSGVLRIGGKQHRFDPQHASLLMDDHKGYYPRKMVWDWLTGVGEVEGQRLGFNLTANQSKDPIQYNENAFWLNDRRFRLPPIRFERANTWRVRDAAGLVDIEFEPQAHKNLNIDASPLLAVNYKSPMGVASGSMRSICGNEVSFSGAAAMAEDFFVLF